MVFEPQNRKLLKPAISLKRNLPKNFLASDAIFYKGQESYSTYDCYLKFLQNARLTRDSIVFKNGFLVKEILYSREHERYFQTRYLLKNLIKSKKIALDDDKKYLLATDDSSSGHFHWLTEVLPRLYCAKDFSKDFVLLLPDTPYVEKIGIESLKLLNLEFQDIVLLRENEFYKAKSLYYISKLCRTGQMHDEVTRGINSTFLQNKKKGDKKIYISREKAGFRKILNEKEIIEVLKANGFEILHGEELSLSEQIEIFSSCKTLLGIHGAGLANCLFMPPESNVVELRKNEINVGYWFLADSLNHNYYYYNGTPDSERSVIGRGCNLTIPIDDFEKKILKVLQ